LQPEIGPDEAKVDAAQRLLTIPCEPQPEAGTMADLQAFFDSNAWILLLSAAVVGTAIVVILLARTTKTVHRYVCRLGRHPTRIELTRTRGPVTVSIRPMDRNHIWVAVEGPAEASFHAETMSEQPSLPT
jgi:hypothetical protein